MAYKILEKNGVLNENIDGAAFNKFCFHRKNGIVPSVLNECAVQSSSNILTLETGLFAVQGFRVKITEAMSWGMLSSDKTGEYRLVFEIRLYSDRSVEGTFFTQPLTVPLITEDILRSEAGAYQIEIARFVWDGSSILSLKRTLYVLSTESGGSVHISQELGDSEEATVSQKVITENLNTKLDKPTEAGGIWAVTWEYGKQKTKRLATSTGWSYALPMYDDNSTLKVNDPTLATGNQDFACANKKYVDKLGSALSDRTTDLERRMKNVEAAVLGNTYLTEEDSSAAYKKIVPLAALPYAGIERMGGAVKGGNGEVQTFPYAFSIEQGSDSTVESDGQGNYTITGVIGSTPQIVLYDIADPGYIEAGEYEFFLEGTGTAWEIWCADIEVYDYSLENALFSQTAYASRDARIAFTLEQGGRYILHVYTIGAVGEVGTLTITPKLVKKAEPIEKSPVTAIKVAGAQLFDETQITKAANSKAEASTAFGVVENGYLRAKYGAHAFSILWLPFKMNLDVGKYTVSADVYVGSSAPNLIVYMGLSAGTEGTNLQRDYFECSAYDMWERKTVTVEITESGDYFFTGCGKGAPEKFTNFDVRFKNIKIERGTTATDFVPYQEPVTAYTVSQDIQDIDGYGLGISDSLYNYIDFENQTFVRIVAERAYQEGDISNETMLTDGVITLYTLATPEIVDISDLLTFDGVVAVEGGGEIIAENALALAIPSTVLYQVKI